jgi:hypothetical protein
MKNLKLFILDIDACLGKLIFKNQSGFARSSRDLLWIVFKGLRPDWTPKQGAVDVEDFKLENCTFVKLDFSETYFFNEIPPPLKKVISNNIIEIKRYLGEDFSYERPMFWVNKNLPDWAASYDIYANIWHMDSHDGQRLLKIFINIDETKEEDGPLIYLDRKQTKSSFHLFWNRWTFESMRQKSPLYVAGQKKFISSKGGYLILNTANCYHRASIPSEDGARKFLQITLYPCWVKKSGEIRKIYD